MSWLGKLSTAQQVRLWFILGVEILSFILIFVAISQLNYSPYFDVTVASGNTLGVVVWLLIAQVAVVTLAVITGYRLIYPKSPHVCGGTSDDATHH
jgi:hypothetical protein